MTTVASVYAARLGADLQRDPAQDRIVARMDALAAALRQPSAPRSWRRGQPAGPVGLYIWGDVGRGKSMLAEMMIEALPDLAPRRMHFHAFMRDIHRALHHARTAQAENPLDTAADRVTADVTLLVLDELEITDIVDAMIVGRVFDRILAQGVTLVITSNRPPAALYSDGVKRELFVPFVQLIEDRMDVLHLDTPRDYRRDDAQDHAMADPAGGRRTIDAIWQDRAGGKETEIRIGHDLQLSLRDSIARASFDTLCRHPLTASDYITFADHADMLLLDSIPYLTEKDDDAARRFILLIDTFYDAGKTIVLDAPAAPEHLYDEGAFTQEYRRTISRLYQMSRPDWASTGAAVR